MTAYEEMAKIKAIANGESFDPVQAIRLLASRVDSLTTTPAKEPPAAVMDAEQTSAKKRPAKETAAQE